MTKIDPQTEQSAARIRGWIRQNHGVLTQTASMFGLSIAFVQRIAYNQSARSKGLRVERYLMSRGCPLIQSDEVRKS